MLDIIIRGGHVVTPEGVGQWDVAIKGEKIVALAAPGTLLNDVVRVIDARGKLVIPGGIDPHVHSRWSLDGGKTHLGAPPGPVSRAALWGGTTTLVDFAIWQGSGTIAQAVAEKGEAWRESHADYALHVMLLGTLPHEVIEQVPETISAGFPSFKIFMTNTTPLRHGRMVDLGRIWALMQHTARHGGIIAIHAEDNDIVMYSYEKLEREGRTGFENMPLAHNHISEDLSFRRVIRLAQHVEGAALYMMHVSAKTGVDAVAEARAAGYPVYAELLHNYASFTADAYQRPDGQIYHTYPSLRYEEDRQRMWEGLRKGIVSTFGTDELCTPRAVKLQGRTIYDTTGGHHGCETRVPIVYTEGVSKRGLSLERFVAATSSHAAKILGLYPQKGAIAVGSDADIVIFDPTIRKTLTINDLHESDYSIWEGWEVHGWPILTILRGQIAVENGELKAPAGFGRRVPGKLLRAIQDGPAV